MTDSFHHDVIVIGGGPAGSTVARYAAAGGADVLVIDGRDPIGTPLQCGELVPSNDEMRRLCPDVPDMDDLFKTPQSAVSRISTEMHLVPPSGNPLKFPFEGYVLNRVAHDEALVELAKENGAKYLVDSHVSRVEGETVYLRNGSSYTAKIIVGAGGHNDPLRRDFWDESSTKIPVKFVLMDGEFGDAVELHFGSMAPGGYAWMFPKSSGANIGLGIQRSFAKGRSLNKYAEDFISKYEGEVSFRGAGSLPMSGSIRTFVKGNYLLVGDSAGMVLPSNGAGITIAMIGGRIAGQVISENLQNGTALDEYEKRWKKQMGKVMRNSKRAFRFGSLMFRLPNWMLNALFNRLTKGIIWRAVTCRRMFWII
ncbi:MAG: NAD(P)/FAD-dependent oxidoreductase [Candidatus Thalassarchaeaceae archaeon]|jgi:digeranylgeranylglycerophospholipid reductase|nr:NAD(P)/FAD-dependent oxidoreductase [Candidatus Thalassarchaeaceae archaeon]